MTGEKKTDHLAAQGQHLFCLFLATRTTDLLRVRPYFPQVKRFAVKMETSGGGDLVVGECRRISLSMPSVIASLAPARYAITLGLKDFPPAADNWIDTHHSFQSEAIKGNVLFDYCLETKK